MSLGLIHSIEIVPSPEPVTFTNRGWEGGTAAKIFRPVDNCERPTEFKAWIKNV